MANPNTVPANSAGSEILRRSYVNNISNTSTLIINGVANYTYIVMSVIFCEVADADELITMYVNYDGGGTGIHLLNQQELGAKETFIWNDKIMLAETDDLYVQTHSASAVDVYCTYIEQRWV